MKGQKVLTTDVADVEYSGNAGITSDCVRALVRLIYGGELFREAFLITCESRHAFVLFGQFDDVFVVKDGFTSGYVGEGPRGLAVALNLLSRHGVEVDEYEVCEQLFHRLEHSCLLTGRPS